jgi:L,D-peptidoglycan transpeptidase YkuD (ErfK/YbiS/YcfS/YnhG family)
MTKKRIRTHEDNTPSAQHRRRAVTHGILALFVVLALFCGMSGCSEDVSREDPAKAAAGKTPVVQPEEVHGGKALDGTPLTPPQSLAQADPAAPASATPAVPPGPAVSPTPAPSAPAAASPPAGTQAAAPTVPAGGPLEAARKLVLVVSPDWDSSRAELSLFARDSLSAPWKRLGNPASCMVGRKGLAWGRGLAGPAPAGPRKKEGDGKTPAGLFPLPTAFGYEPPAKAAQAGIRLPYQELTASTVCVTDPDSAAFNDLADSKKSSAAWTRQDRMIRDDNANRLGAFIGHNRPDPQPGLGSCVFLNIEPAPNKATGGSIGCPEPLAREILAWLDPESKPLIAILPQSALAAAQTAWGLPR